MINDADTMKANENYWFGRSKRFCTQAILHRWLS